MIIFMTALTIRDVPEDILTAVKVHAAKAGKSLQAYMLELLAHDAAQPTPITPVGETRGERAVRRLSGSATNPETRGMSTDQLMELLRGE
jgi:plasmid stability protein